MGISDKADAVGLGKPEAPAAPDYVGAAQAQGGANLDAAIAQGILNRPNEVTPLGSRNWNQTGSYNVGGRAVPIFTGTTAFTPTGQKLYDTNIATQQELGNLGLQGAQKANQILGQQFNVGQIPGIERTGNFDRESIYNSLVARAEGQNTQDRDAARSQLVAQGIPVGSEAYNREMASLDRRLNDARQQAHLGAGQQQSQQLDARRQMIQEALLNRQTPLNEISALRSGSQVQQPNFQPYAANANVQAAPLFAGQQAQGNAAMQNYQTQSDQYNAMMSGLFRLGSAMALA